jgi:hypothetical protein
MKKKFKLIVALFIMAGCSSYAQQNGRQVYDNNNSIRLNFYGSYAFEDSFDSYYDYGNYYQGQLKDGFQYGAGLEFEVRPDSYVELLYLRQDTHAPTQYYNGGLYDKYANFDVAMNYIMLGGNQSFRKTGKNIEGFGGLMAGVAVIDIKNPSTNYSGSATKFAWGLKGGVIIWATKGVGLKLQGQLLSVAQSVGGGVYFGPGGASTGISSYSSLYQFTIGGGLVFELGDKN